MLLTSLNPWRKIPSVEAATLSAVAEKAEVYFSNIARLSSKIRINKAAPTVFVTIIGAAILLTSRNASSNGRAINKDDQHLHQFGDKSNGTRGQWTKDFIGTATTGEHAVHQPAEQTFDNGRDHATERGHVRPLNNDVSHRLDRPNRRPPGRQASPPITAPIARVLAIESSMCSPKSGAQNAEDGKGNVAKQLVREPNRDLHQRDKQTRFAHEPRDNEKHTHLLKQQQHQIKLVHTCQPHITLKARNIHWLRVTFFEVLQKNKEFVSTITRKRRA